VVQKGVGQERIREKVGKGGRENPNSGFGMFLKKRLASSHLKTKMAKSKSGGEGNYIEPEGLESGGGVL